MKCVSTSIADVKIFEPQIFTDERGYFMETFTQKKFEECCNEQIIFCQENESQSKKNVLRGLHYQVSPCAQSKLVRVISGEILDVAVDLRKNSVTYKKHVAIKLSDENKKQLFIPQGFAHGFLVLSEKAIVSYKVDNYYSPKHEKGIAWNDKSLNIDWSLNGEIDEKNFIISKKDLEYKNL